MGLTKSQQAIWERSRAAGAGAQGVCLSDSACAFLVARVASDLALGDRFPELPAQLPRLYDSGDSARLVLDGLDARALFERLVALNSDADTYYACLAALHRARLKYDSILKSQPIATLEQVGPRCLLQYGQLSARALTAFLCWRKWFFDIDNRAGQETGYLFEPIIAHAVGGTPVPAAKSPVRRRGDKRKRRQIDCLLSDRAYEFKIRLTIAASGQGRWREELDYPIECRRSGFTPVLIVLDSTANPKLQELVDAFRAERGEAFVGKAAWEHLDELAGPTMAMFLERYVRAPIDDLIRSAPDPLPDLLARISPDRILLTVGDETMTIRRSVDVDLQSESDALPPDVTDGLSG